MTSDQFELLINLPTGPAATHPLTAEQFALFEIEEKDLQAEQDLLASLGDSPFAQFILPSLGQNDYSNPKLHVYKRLIQQDGPATVVHVPVLEYGITEHPVEHVPKELVELFNIPTENEVHAGYFCLNLVVDEEGKPLQIDSQIYPVLVAKALFLAYAVNVLSMLEE